MKSLQKLFIKFCRYVLQIKFLPAFAGPVKGMWWSTSVNYDFLTGTYEDPATLKVFTSWLNSRTIFYDLGANTGYYSIIASKIISEGIIHAFEPVSAHRKLFEAHIERNAAKIHPVIALHPYAITSHRQTLSFTNTSTEGASYIKKGDNTMEVQGVSIDELIAEGFPPPGVMKIDVEGAEYDVLSGSIKTIEQYRPKILLATHDSHLPGVRQKCIELLQRLGYDLKHTGHFNKHHSGLDDYLAEHKQTEVTY